MAYNPLIPQAGDFISQSQKQFLTNFSQTGLQFGFDHVSLDDEVGINRGKHKKVTFQEQAGDQTTGPTDYSMYTKDTSGSPQMYFRPESDGTVYKGTNGAFFSPALKLRASVIFDGQGNILKNQADEELKFNVSSITIPNALLNGVNVRDDWVVNFENDLGTTNYIWVLNSFYAPFPRFNLTGSVIATTVPYMFGVYGDAIKTGSIRVMTKNVNGLSTAAQGLSQVVQVQIYTVA